MKFTTIIQKLREVRKSAHAYAVQQARKEFGAEFNAQFTYRRGDQDYVMTRPSAIVKRYTELTGKDVVL